MIDNDTQLHQAKADIQMAERQQTHNRLGNLGNSGDCNAARDLLVGH